MQQNWSFDKTEHFRLVGLKRYKNLKYKQIAHMPFIPKIQLTQDFYLLAFLMKNEIF